MVRRVSRPLEGDDAYAFDHQKRIVDASFARVAVDLRVFFDVRRSVGGSNLYLFVRGVRRLADTVIASLG